MNLCVLRRITAAAILFAASGADGMRAAAKDILTEAAKEWNLDQPIPASPAFTALGVTPETVTHPSTPRELGTSLLNGVDKDGELQAGVAIDFAPYQLLFGPEVSLSDYRDSRLTRFLYNFQVSLATAKAGEGESKEQRLALGFQFTAFNRGDLRLNKPIDDLVDAFYNSAGLPRSRPGVPTEETDRLWRAQVSDKATALAADIKKIRDANWSASSMFFAASPVWLTKSGKTENLKADGATYWGTYAWGFEGVKALHKRAQFLIHARYRDRETMVDETTPTITYRQNSFFGAARLRFGRPDLHFSVEGGIVSQRPEGRPEKRVHRVGGSIETRIRENLWLVISAGNDIAKSGAGDDGTFAIAGLRFGTSETPTLK